VNKTDRSKFEEYMEEFDEVEKSIDDLLFRANPTNQRKLQDKGLKPLKGVHVKKGLNDLRNKVSTLKVKINNYVSKDEE